MTHWNQPHAHGGSLVDDSSSSSNSNSGGGRGGGSSSRGGSGAGSQPHPQRSHLRGGGGGHRRPAPGSRLLPTSLLLDSEVLRRLKRVQAAIEALSLQVGEGDGARAAPRPSACLPACLPDQSGHRRPAWTCLDLLG